VARLISGYDAVPKDEVGTARKSDEINNLLREAASGAETQQEITGQKYFS